MRKTVPVVFYTGSERVVIGEAVVEDEDFPLAAVSPNAEINLNNAGLSLRKDF
jgi:hypothetical protein